MTEKAKYTNIDEYIAGFPETVQTILHEMRRTIRNAAPDAIEKISYGIPTFFLNGNLVHFGGFKDHVSFFPGAVGMETFREKLSSYEISKGTVRFPTNKTIPYDLVKEITVFRVRQNLEKKKLKKQKT